MREIMAKGRHKTFPIYGFDNLEEYTSKGRGTVPEIKTKL